MDYLKELAFLTLTAGGDVIKTFTQRLSNPNPRTFIGEGKITEIKTLPSWVYNLSSEGSKKTN